MVLLMGALLSGIPPVQYSRIQTWPSGVVPGNQVVSFLFLFLFLLGEVISGIRVIFVWWCGSGRVFIGNPSPAFEPRQTLEEHCPVKLKLHLIRNSKPNHNGLYVSWCPRKTEPTLLIFRFYASRHANSSSAETSSPTGPFHPPRRSSRI